MAKDMASLIAIGMGRPSAMKHKRPPQRKSSVYIPPDDDVDADPDDDGDDDRYPETDSDSDYAMDDAHDHDDMDDDMDDTDDMEMDEHDSMDEHAPSPEQVDCAHDAIRALKDGDAKGLAEAILAITGR